MPKENTNIRRILFNEISLCIAGVGLVSSCIFWITNPQQEIELAFAKLESQVESYESVGSILQKFKDNDLHELELQMTRIEDRQIDMIKSIAALEVQQ